MWPTLNWKITGISFVLVSCLAFLPLLGLIYYVLVADLPEFIARPDSLWMLWQQQDMTNLTLRTLILGITVASLNVFLGTCLASIAQRYVFAGKKVIILISLIPLAIPSYILAATLRDSFSAGGFLGDFLNLTSFTGFIPTTLVLVIATLPYTQLLLTTHLNNNTHLQEEAAARTLGANNRQIFYYITWPYLRPMLALTWLITFLYAISDFGAVAVLNYPVLTWRLYQAVEYQQLLWASLIGSTLLVLSLPLFLFMRFLQGNRLQTTQIKFYSFNAVSLPSTLIFPAFLIFASVIFLGVWVPLEVLFSWTLQGFNQALIFAEVISPLRASVILAFLGASIIILLAFLPAWASARSKRLFDVYIEQMVYLTSGLPAILVAFGLLLIALAISQFFTSQYWYHFLIASGILLMLGYSLRFLPQAYAYLKFAIMQLSPQQYANARILGASPQYWRLHLALPELWPSIRGAWIIVALSICKELPITLLLGNAIGLQPLSVRMFDRYQEAFLHDAGIAGLTLVLICILLTLWSLKFKVYTHG